MFGGLLKLIPVIVTAVKLVEGMLSKKGKEKQDAAVLLVGEIIPLIEGSIEKELLNEQTVQSALRDTIDAIVKLMNVITKIKQART